MSFPKGLSQEALRLPPATSKAFMGLVVHMCRVTHANSLAVYRLGFQRWRPTPIAAAWLRGRG